jgi:hypothetical protein
MGWHFRDLSETDPFAIDQIQTVDFGERIAERRAQAMRHATPALRALGGTAGFLVDEAPRPWRGGDVDAALLSVENTME